jgi:hypothetical protein
MSSVVPQEQPILVWLKVLGRIEEVLERSLAQAVDPVAEQAVESSDVAAARLLLQRLEERLTEMGACLERAEQNAAATDALLASEVSEMQRWRQTLAETGRNLAEWAARAI